MQARGPLMIEHRLIERMIGLIENTLGEIESTNSVDCDFIDTAVDFIRVYADRTHHGKEEDILFRDLKKKPLSEEDRKMMDGLIEDHVYGRQTTKALEQANTRYRNGDQDALDDISGRLSDLVNFYPHHIEKEDKTFFPASRNYLTDKEDQAMLEEFREFDRKMIHEKYESVIKWLEKSRSA